MEHYSSLAIPLVVLLGIACQWLSWRVHLPAILFLLLAGLTIGPYLNIFNPSEYFGDVLKHLISFSVAIILFEGALTLRFRQIKTVFPFVRNIITVGAFVSLVLTALITHYIMNMSWSLSLLFGALVMVTGPTVITPLLRNTRANARVSSILKWESVLIDPIGAITAVVIFNFIISSNTGEHSGIWSIIGQFVSMSISAGAIGFFTGVLIYWILRKYLLPDYLRDIAILGIILGTFELSNLLYHDSGLLAVTITGLVLANVRLQQIHEIWHFKEKLSTLLVSILFILLASNISIETLRLLDWKSLVVVLLLMVLVRPASILASTLLFTNKERSFHKLNWGEKLFLGCIAPRGIVAASISSLFAIELYSLGIEEAAILAPLTFLVIVATVLINGISSKHLALLFKVAEPHPQGFLFLSANKFSRLLASSLQQEGFIVKLVDNNWSHVRAAKIQHLDAYHGNILSEEIEAEADLSGIARLFALTSNQEANVLACVDYRNQFGSSEVYRLSSKENRRLGINQMTDDKQIGRILFGEQYHLNRINNFIHHHGVIKKIALTEQYTYEKYTEEYKDKGIALLAFRQNKVNPAIKDVWVRTMDAEFNPGAGWSILVLIATE